MSQVWQVNTLGGYMYSDELSDTMRTALQPIVKFRQFCDAKDATDKGLERGEAFQWNVYSNVQQQGGQLQETQRMPKTRFTVRQGSLTITEYGNSVDYTKKLDNLSKQPVEEIIHKVLKHDAVKAIDKDAWQQFDNCVVRVAPTGGNSTTSVTFEEGLQSTITNNVAMGKEHVKLISDGMKERNIPPYKGDDYMAIARPTTLRTFKNDLEALKIYVDVGFGMVMNGEIGRYEGVRFCEQTHINKGGAYDSITAGTYDPIAPGGADPWNNNLSDWCYYFGEDTVAEALAIPEEIRGAIPTDFGRDRGVAWYALLGFGIVHGEVTDSAQGRIVKWDSAA